jgi:hypothetical protein
MIAILYSESCNQLSVSDSFFGFKVLTLIEIQMLHCSSIPEQKLPHDKAF